MKVVIKNIRFPHILIIASSFLYGTTSFAIALYAAVFLFIIELISKYSKRIINYSHMFLAAMIYICMLPDNYSVVLLGYLFFAGFLLTKRKMRIDKCLVAMVGIILFSTIINFVPPINVFFNFLYLVPFFLFASMCEAASQNLNIKDLRSLDCDLKVFVISQTVAILGYFVTHLSSMKSNLDFDWVYGTLGVSQGVVLCILLVMIGVYFFFLGENKYGVLSVLLAVLTGTISIMILTFCYLGILAIVSPKINIKYKIFIIVSIVTLFFGALFFNKGWITEQLISIAKGDFSSIEKIKTYKTTFWDLPIKDVLFNFIGNGAGYYSSRSAMTCTGRYLDAINIVSMSDYTRMYIYPQFIIDLEILGGMRYSPYSSIITMRGEFGLVGFLCMLVYFLKLMKIRNKFASFIVAFWLITMTIENFMEFPKIQFMCFMLYFMMKVIDYNARKALVK